MTKAIRKGRRPRDRWYWDLEASDRKRRWDGITLSILKREDGETVIYKGESALAKTCAFMEKNPEIYYGHYSGGYDTVLMLNYLRFEKLILTGTLILSAEGRRGLSLRDTFPYWLAGLDKIGKAVGLPKLDVDRAQIELLSMDELVEYCMRDVDVLRLGMIECRGFLEEYGVNPDQVSTAGTAATGLMRKIEKLSYAILSANKIQTQLIGEMLNDCGNPGAMTACYALGHRETVHCFDVKSSYPARYANREVPVGLRRADANELARPEHFQGIAECTFYWPHRRRVPIAYDDLSGAGFGYIRTWLVDDEIRCLLEEGIAVKLHSGWCGIDYAPIGQDFARELFAAKERPGPRSFFPKTFVNSWHGKTGMNPVRENFQARYPREWWNPTGDPVLDPKLKGWLWHFRTLAADKEGFGKWYFQPMISAIVLGRARAALWRINNAFQKAGWEIYYNDTDSLFTNCPPELSPVLLGNNLGQLAYEGGPYRGIFLGSKAYILIDENDVVKKCALKGVPHKSYKDALWEGDTVREARGDERVQGTYKSPFARKGVGRDERIALFERALASSAKAYKEGVRTFKKGLVIEAKGESKELSWARDSLTREIRPTITNLSFDADGWRLLSADEIVY